MDWPVVAFTRALQCAVRVATPSQHVARFEQVVGKHAQECVAVELGHLPPNEMIARDDLLPERPDHRQQRDPCVIV